MDMVRKEDAKKLAIAYQTYQEAVDNGKQNSIAVWGKMLLEAQEETGIILASADNVQYFIEEANKSLDK